MWAQTKCILYYLKLSFQYIFDNQRNIEFWYFVFSINFKQYHYRIAKVIVKVIYINQWSDTINHVIPKANLKYWIYYEITHVSHVQTNSAETSCVLEGVVFTSSTI